LRTQGRIDAERALSILRAVCAGVHGAHQHGLIHRDLKPENIFLTPEGAKILDFGLSKLVAPAMHDSTARTLTQQTGVGTIAGTLEYMSPEQLDPAVTVPSINWDIWALGVISYEMLTGTSVCRSGCHCRWDCDPARELRTRVGKYARCARPIITALPESLLVTSRMPSDQRDGAI